MINLLNETIKCLANNNKGESDVLWVGDLNHKSDWLDFKSVANVDCDNSYGSAKVAQDLLIVGDNWWLERCEYDGSEWWEYKELPREPNNKIKINALTICQAENNGLNVSCGWEGLSTLNAIKD